MCGKGVIMGKLKLRTAIVLVMATRKAREVLVMKNRQVGATGLFITILGDSQ
jgi:phage terminase large subunit GpA-like protein